MAREEPTPHYYQGTHPCRYVNIEYEGQTGEMPLLIVGGWLSQIQLNWREIHHVHSASLQSFDTHQFSKRTLKGFQARIYVDPHAKPEFHPARSVPYALRLIKIFSVYNRMARLSQ